MKGPSPFFLFFCSSSNITISHIPFYHSRMAKRTPSTKPFLTKSFLTKSTNYLSSRQKRSITRLLIAVLAVICFILSGEESVSVLSPKHVTPLPDKTKILIVSEYRAGGDAVAQIFNKHADAVYFHEPLWMLIKENITDFLSEEETEQGVQLIQSFFKYCDSPNSQCRKTL